MNEHEQQLIASISKSNAMTAPRKVESLVARLSPEKVSSIKVVPIVCFARPPRGTRDALPV